ncbi:MAG: hypothetical protein CR982_00425 [Candidatus Cloacimonadota bacterium]|nr:MAG: hypothetical protein CR982_00425 [Candidatus Cloacimonadota bacterium]
MSYIKRIKFMKIFDTIIIGGGLGGLTAGAKLAKEGKKVCLIEQHSIVGGCATTFRRKDFIVEVGLHEMDGLDEDDLKVKVFKELDVFKNIELIKVPEFYRFKHGETDIVIPDNKDEAIRLLIEKFPNEKRGIKKFFKKIFAIRNEINRLLSKKWQMFILFPVFPLLFPNLSFSSRQNLGDFLDKIIKDEELKLVLQANLSYYHDDPYSMSLIYFSAGQTSFFAGGGYFIKGGSGQLSNYLAQIITDNNGEILLGSQVEKIVIKDSKAVGVEYGKRDGKDKATHQLFAKTIIANTAIPNVVELLPNEYQELLRKKVEKLKISSSILSVYIGFKKEVKDLGNNHYSTFIFDDKIKQLADVYSKNSIDKFVFLDYSQIDSGLAPKGKSLGVICTPDYIENWEDLDKKEYKSKKEEVGKILIQKLEEKIPNITNEIEYLEVATPKTIKRYTLNTEGTAYGYAQIPNQSGIGRLPNKSPVKNLYFASAWVNPGGGFTGAILSGWFCANEVLRNRG